MTMVDRDTKMKVHLDGPAEEEEKAEKKLSDAGFHPGNYTEPHDFGSCAQYRYDTPLIHFCRLGDIRMCRYLIERGASVHEPDRVPRWSPMKAASFHLSAPITADTLTDQRQTRFAICQLLVRNGADLGGHHPTSCWAINFCGEECQWFVLNGVICDSDGNVSRRLIVKCFGGLAMGPCVFRQHMLSWAEEALYIHDTFKVILLGTLTPRDTSSAPTVTRKHTVSHLRSLGGKAGILEQISDYVGVAKGRDLRILRQFATMMRPFAEIAHIASYGSPDLKKMAERTSKDDVNFMKRLASTIASQSSESAGG